MGLAGIYKFRLILFLLSCGLASTIWAADPLGRQGAFLGNTTARSSEIGSAFYFPSVYAYRAQKNTEYTTNFLFASRSYLKEHYKVEAYKLLPYFTATGIQSNNFTFTFFIHNQNTSAVEIKESSDKQNIFQESIDTVWLGLATSLRGKQLSGGLSLAVGHTQWETTTMEQALPLVNDFFKTNHDAHIYQLRLTGSLTWRWGQQLLTLSVAPPTIVWHTSLKASNAATLSHEPRHREKLEVSLPYNIGLGYFYDAVREARRPIALTAEIRYQGPSEFQNVKGKAVWHYATGVKVKFNHYNLLGGIQYTSKAMDAQPASLGLSGGWQWRKILGQPILGPWYKRYDFRHPIHEIGLLFSIGQW
jgi:hypothetical protein